MCRKIQYIYRATTFSELTSFPLKRALRADSKRERREAFTPVGFSTGSRSRIRRRRHFVGKRKFRKFCMCLCMYITKSQSLMMFDGRKTFVLKRR